MRGPGTTTVAAGAKLLNTGFTTSFPDGGACSTAARSSCRPTTASSTRTGDAAGGSSSRALIRRTATAARRPAAARERRHRRADNGPLELRGGSLTPSTGHFGPGAGTAAGKVRFAAGTGRWRRAPTCSATSRSPARRSPSRRADRAGRRRRPARVRHARRDGHARRRRLARADGRPMTDAGPTHVAPGGTLVAQRHRAGHGRPQRSRTRGSSTSPATGSCPTTSRRRPSCSTTGRARPCARPPAPRRAYSAAAAQRRDRREPVRHPEGRGRRPDARHRDVPRRLAREPRRCSAPGARSTATSRLEDGRDRRPASAIALPGETLTSAADLLRTGGDFSGNLRVTGTMTWSGGRQVGPGTTTVAPGRTRRVDGLTRRRARRCSSPTGTGCATRGSCASSRAPTSRRLAAAPADRQRGPDRARRRRRGPCGGQTGILGDPLVTNTGTIEKVAGTSPAFVRGALDNDGAVRLARGRPRARRRPGGDAVGHVRRRRARARRSRSRAARSRSRRAPRSPATPS